MEQLVDLEQALAVDADEVTVHFEKAPVFQPLNRCGEMRQRVRAELRLNLRTADLAELELEDELADETFVRTGRERAKGRELAAIHALDVRVELVMVLVMDAVQMSEARDADGENIRTGEESFAIDELHFRRIFHDRGGARHGVADLLKLVVGVVDPATFRFPVRHGRDEFAFGLHLLIDAGVVGHFHLVNGQRIGLKRDGLGDGFLPQLFRLLDHAGDEIDVDLREANLAGEGVGARDFLRAMRASVDLQDVIVEVLDAEAEPRDAEFANGLQLVVSERAGFCLEGDFLHLIPREQSLHAVGEELQLIGRQIAGRATAEVDEARLASFDERLVRVGREILQQRVEVAANLRRVLVGIDLEVAEVAALPAKRNVRVEPEVHAGRGLTFERGLQFADAILFPVGERRVVRDEVIACGRFLLKRRSGGRGRRW